jgi:redox-sensitive bicupin YhaK (pirin superfamily)
MTAPRYQDIRREEIPEETCQNGSIRVIAGQFEDTRGVVQTHLPITYLDIRLSAGGAVDIPLPKDANAFAYIIEGEALFSEDEFPGSHPELLVFSKGETLSLRSKTGSRILLIAAEPLGEPIARHGPFVMNTREELMQAIVDYQNGVLMDSNETSSRKSD